MAAPNPWLLPPPQIMAATIPRLLRPAPSVAHPMASAATTLACRSRISLPANSRSSSAARANPRAAWSGPRAAALRSARPDGRFEHRQSKGWQSPARPPLHPPFPGRPPDHEQFLPDAVRELQILLNQIAWARAATTRVVSVLIQKSAVLMEAVQIGERTAH
jgi:hypothetical protein